MASLTETAYISRKAINIGVIVVVLGIAFRIAVGLAGDLWQKLFPPPPPPATVAFGRLPYPNAANNVATPSGLTYTLETVDGSLPKLTPTLKVYFMLRPGPSFGSFDRMKTEAGTLGFRETPRKTGPTSWRVLDKDTPLRTLDIDEVTGNFRLTYNFLSDLSLFNEKNFSNQNQMIMEGQQFVGGVNGMPAGLKNGQPSLAFFRLDSGILVSTTSLSNADAISVTFNRGDIDGQPVVSPDPKQGLVSVLFSGSSDRKKRIIEARYFYTEVDQENWATYPVVGASAAFDLLKSGKAIYASIPPNLGDKVTIRKVQMAYLDPYPSQSYLQPVVVFSDEKGFMAYVPLVSPEWLQ